MPSPTPKTQIPPILAINRGQKDIEPPPPPPSCTAPHENHRAPAKYPCQIPQEILLSPYLSHMNPLPPKTLQRGRQAAAIARSKLGTP